MTILGKNTGQMERLCCPGVSSLSGNSKEASVAVMESSRGERSEPNGEWFWKVRRSWASQALVWTLFCCLLCS